MDAPDATPTGGPLDCAGTGRPGGTASRTGERRTSRRHPPGPARHHADGAPPPTHQWRNSFEQHRSLPHQSDRQREQQRGAARAAAVRASEHYADLLTAEAGIAARTRFADLARLAFRLTEDVDGTSATLVAAYTADGRRLWHVDIDDEWPDESEVTDLLAAAAEWTWYHDTHFPSAPGDPDLLVLDPDAWPPAGSAAPPADEPSFLVRRLLNLSTAHLPADLGTSGLDTAAGVVAHRTEHGWLMWVPDDPDESTAVMADPVVDVVLAIQRYARARGCDYVLLDADADRVDDLPTWDW